MRSTSSDPAFQAVYLRFCIIHPHDAVTEVLVEKVSGESVSEKYLVESLYRRYGPIHGLSADPVGAVV